VHVAPLHPVRREHRSDGVAVVVDHEDRAVARHDRDHRLVAARRREGTEEAAAVLLIDGQRERSAVKSRLVRLRPRMMRMRAAQYDRMAFAFPSAPKVGGCGLCRRRRGGNGGERCERDEASKI